MDNEIIANNNDLKILEDSRTLAECNIELISSPEFSDAYGKLVEMVDYLNDLKKAVDGNVKELVKERFFESGESSLITNGFRYTYVPATTRESFDSKRFKKEDPETYKKYISISAVNESVRVTKIGEK